MTRTCKRERETDPVTGRLFDLRQPDKTPGEPFDLGFLPHKYAAFSTNVLVFATEYRSAYGKDAVIRVFDIHAAKATQRYDIPIKGPSPFQGMILSADGQWITCAGSLWQLDKDQPRYVRGATGYAFTPDSKQLLVRNDTRLELRNLETWEASWMCSAPFGYINEAAFAPDGRHLLIGNRDGTAYILRLDPKIVGNR